MDKIIIGVSVVAVAGVIVVLASVSLRRRFGGSGYSNVASDGSVKPKRNMFKKFEDYWDEESEDHSANTTTPTMKGASTNYDDYWDEKNDLSTHSNHPLNISLPKRS